MFKKRKMKLLKKILITFFIGYPLMLVAYIFPRNNKLWIISSLNDFNCNSKYFFIFFKRRKPKNISLYWIAKDKHLVNEMKKKGINDVLYIFSLKGIYFLFRSGAYITSYPIEESINFWTMGRAKYINLWHGVGLKYHRFMQNDKKTYFLFKNKITKFIFYPLTLNFYRQFDLFLSTTPKMTYIFQTSFRIKSKNIIEALYPRCEFLTQDRKIIDYTIEKYCIHNEVNLIKLIKKHNKSFLYMPTWRESNPNFISDIKFDYLLLNKKLKKNNQLFIFKLHPRTPSDSLPKETFSNILFLKNKLDIYSILPFINTLITDYSSIYYDVLLNKKIETILFPFDQENYENHNRNLAYDYNEMTDSNKIYNFDELINKIEDENNNSAINVEKENLKDIFWPTDSSRNFDYILAEIKKRVIK